jgi:hypothetical protein
MASTITRQHIEAQRSGGSALFSSIESKGLVARLKSELSQAGREFLTNPAGFIRESLASSWPDSKRKRRMYAGISVAAAIYAAVLVAALVVGVKRGFVAPQAAKNPEYVIQMVPRPVDPPADQKVQPGANGIGGATVSRGNGGGGGGGQNSAIPASNGIPPRMMPLPQIVKATFDPDTSPPSLPVNPTTVGPMSAPPPPAPLGVLNGSDGPTSPGTGTGDGIGNGHGTGAGNGNGAGIGPGNGVGQGGSGTPGLPKGHGDIPSGPIAWNSVQGKPGFKNIVWIYRPHATISPEAAASAPNGWVLLRATFHLDGTISDIEVAQTVDYMTEAAIESLKHSKFQPATLNGQPITLTRMLIKINVTTRGSGANDQ